MDMIDKNAVCAEERLRQKFSDIDKIRYLNQIKVLDAMRKHKLCEADFAYSNGYGYNDKGREKTEKVYSEVFGTDDALVRHQIVSGTHAISISLFASLDPGDSLLSVYGEPYDTLRQVIGTTGDLHGSLLGSGVNYDFVSSDDDLTYFDRLSDKLRKKPSVCLIQRSRGYSVRRSLSVGMIRKIISLIRDISPDSIVVTDNCYGEFVEDTEPSNAGSDLTVGSLIKNPGGGIAPCGGYITGKADLVRNCEFRLTCPGIGREVGPSLGHAREILMGLFFAPHIVAESLKGSLFCCELAASLGFTVYPQDIDERTDIVQAVEFKDEAQLINFCRIIQKYSPVDSYVVPFPWKMPGYDDDIIMAAGTFTQGSSIELSCDAPIRAPYIAYMQGGLFYDHTKYAVINAFKDIIK